jgi:hypothetical protein
VSRDSRLALTLVGAAVLLGAAGDWFFRGRPLGLNVLLFSACFVGALALLLRVGRAPSHQGRRWMAAPLLVFSAMFVWHDSPLLTAANAFALAAAVAVGALRRPATADVADYAHAAATTSAAALAGSVRLLQRDMPWQEAGRTFTGPVARGLALGTPLLLLFGGLFFAADSMFQHLVTSAVPHHIWVHVVVIGGIAWLAAGLLRDLVASRSSRTPTVRSLGRVEVASALGALNVLFAVFVAVQGREAVAHLNYAQYARHGFFELVAVSVLVLPVVLAANALAPSRLTRGLSATLIALELAVAASALDRLRLYEHQFGLTELRLYASGIVLWLGCVFLWLCATTLRGRGRFAVGALVLGFAATGALNVVNPDALIARTNLSRPHVDVGYLARLSDDSVPTLVARWSELPPGLRRALAHRTPPENDVLSWNFSRARARDALGKHP